MANRLVKAAVITGDIVQSTELSRPLRTTLQKSLLAFFEKARKQYGDLRAQQYRGDSVQIVLTENRSAALRVALLLQSHLVKNNYRIRLSIGVGNTSFSGKDVVTSDGTAFQASGYYLDELKKKTELISIAGEETGFTDEWQVHSASLDYLEQRWSREQAEAMNMLLNDMTQINMARKLKITQASVNQRLKLAGSSMVQKILNRFETMVPTL